MKDVLMIAHFTHTPSDPGNDRFVYLAKLLAERDCRVELVTTGFSHSKKTQREIPEERLWQLPYKLTLLREPGYRKNVCLRRFYSHWVFAKSLKKYLSLRNKPDVIYCSVPSPNAARQAARYAEKNGVRLILDVQDLWPEAFEMVFHVPVLSDLVFAPMRQRVNRIYATADEIVAVSDTYVKRALRVNNKASEGTVVFLGTDLEEFDRLAEKNRSEKPKNEIWIGYIGTLGHSYDIPNVIDALVLLQEKGYAGLRFIVMGDGPLKERFEVYANARGIRAAFTGRLPYAQMAGKLCTCDIAVNPIRAGSAGSIINKVGDYAAACLPVINTQECPEYRALVEQYHMGINCKNGDPVDTADGIQMLIQNTVLRNAMAQGARRCAEECFDRGRSYKKIAEKIWGQNATASEEAKTHVPRCGTEIHLEG